MSDSNTIITALLNGKPFRQAKYSSDDLKELLHEIDRRYHALMRKFPLGAAIAEASRPTSYSARFPSYYREPPSPESVEFLKLKDLQTQVKLELHCRGELEELRTAENAVHPTPPIAATASETTARTPANGEREIPKRSRRRKRKPSREVTPLSVLVPSRKRASTVAQLIEELNVLKPQMHNTQNYPALANKYPNYLCFKIARDRDDLRTKLENLQYHHRHIRLAQELTAAHHGRELSTIQTDWQDYKPANYKQKRNRQV